MAATSNPSGIEILPPSWDIRPTVCEISGGGILRGNRKTMERGVPYGVYGGYPVDYYRVAQGPRYSLQDHAVPRSVGYQAERRPLCRHSVREPIVASKEKRGNK